jgi:catalase
MMWDFISLRPETTHQVSFLFSDRGTPQGYRHMNGYGSHTFKLVNNKGDYVYCKFHYKTDQGIKNLSAEEAEKIAGSDPDYSIRDLYNNIAKGNFPSWTAYIQVMTEEQASKCSFNPFDLTKTWSQKEYPLIQYGKMVFNQNPKNYFAEVEQIAFSPSHMVPGIEPSPDKMLQGRLFSYPDTHRHRLGVNYQQIPVNCPYRTKTLNYQRDGPARVDGNQDGAPNYFPNSFGGPEPDVSTKWAKWTVSGEVARHETKDDDNFTQAGIFYNKVLNADERDRLTSNIAGHLSNAVPFIQKRVIENFSKADPKYGQAIADKIAKIKATKASL